MLKTNQPIQPSDAADKLAAAETLYRFAAGIDLKNSDLLASAFAADAVSDFRPAAAKAGFEYPVLQGRENIVAALSGSLKSLDTTHSVSNPRVTVDGDRARLDALVEAQHVPAADPSRHYLMKNRYDVELVRGDDAWVIQRVTIDNVWRSGDPSVLSVI
ncbi:SnoaL-like protein [Novosphingobium sp. PhB165]|nr:SnoaL-like protein [Novosphingobium sp. PhB165]